MKCSDEIDQNIGSVSEMCDRAQTVLFTSKGGAIVADPGGVLARECLRRSKSYTTFMRDRGTYTLDMWVPRKEGQAPNAAVKEAAPAAKRDIHDGDMAIYAVLKGN